jgi:hypothetical protein
VDGWHDTSHVRARRVPRMTGRTGPAAAHQPGAVLWPPGAAGAVACGRRRLGRFGMVGCGGRWGVVATRDMMRPAGVPGAIGGRLVESKEDTLRPPCPGRMTIAPFSGAWRHLQNSIRATRARDAQQLPKCPTKVLEALLKRRPRNDTGTRRGRQRTDS